MTAAGFHPLRVAAVDPLCDDAVAVTFEIPAELRDDYAFRPGQFLTLRRSTEQGEQRRSYSICSPEGAAPRVGVREVPDGLFSSWLVHDVRAGDVVDVHTPQGAFVADPAAGGHHVLVAAGSGITPVLSIAASVLGHPAPERPARVSLVYANRRTSTTMFVDELADLKDEHLASFELVHVLSREPRDVELFSGRLDGERLRRLLTEVVCVEPDSTFWLCGPYGLVTQARAVLGELGVADARIRTELFYVEDVAPAQVHHPEAVPGGPTCKVTVLLDGRETTAALPLDVPLLDAAQRERADLPFACKGGVCGTCRAKVTAGAVDMRRNFALEDAEVAAGFVLTCQSYPVSPRIALDFDR